MAVLKKFKPKNISDESSKFFLRSGTFVTAKRLYCLEVCLIIYLLETNSNSSGVQASGNFANGYWIKVALAKVMSVAVENGTIPKLNETYQLIAQAGCQKDDDLKCLCFASVCAPRVADELLKQLNENRGGPSTKENLPIYMRHIWTKCGMPMENRGYEEDFKNKSNHLKPPLIRFHCTQRKSPDLNYVTFRMEYSSDQQILGMDGFPINISSSVIPRYFVNELYNDRTGRWALYGNSVTDSWQIAVGTNLVKTVQVRVTAVSPSYIYPPMIHSTIPIYSLNLLERRILKPIDVRIDNISVNKNSKRLPRPSALIRWKSGSGLSASCDYDIFYKGSDFGDMNKIEIKKRFWAKLENLDFGRNYSVRVVEKFGQGVDTHADFNFSVPSCLELTGLSPELCPPPSTSNVAIVKTSDSSSMSDLTIREILTSFLALLGV